jgi:hypothetical protein
MERMTEIPIHPDLKLEARFTIVFCVVASIGGAFLTFWGVGLLAIVTGRLPGFPVFESPPPLFAWLLIGTCFLVGLLLLFLGRHLATTSLRRLRRVSWVLAFVQPRRMTLTFPEGSPGRVAELLEEKKPGLSVVAERLEIRSPHWKIVDLSPRPVDVYIEPDPEGIVAMATDAGIIWGFREPRFTIT